MIEWSKPNKAGRKIGYALSGKKNATAGVLCVQCLTDLPWHEAVRVEKSQMHERDGFTAIDATPIFGGAA